MVCVLMLSVQSQTPVQWPHSVLYIEDIGRYVFFSADMYDTIRVTTTERKINVLCYSGYFCFMYELYSVCFSTFSTLI